MVALGLLELTSIGRGIVTGDAMVKRSPVDLLLAGTVHPGKYLLLVAGGVAEVEEAMAAGRTAAGAALCDALFLPDVHPAVVAAAAGERRDGDGDALGVVETTTVAALLGAADRGVKAAAVDLREVRLADGLGGKAYCLFAGAVADVEAAVDAAAAAMPDPALLVAAEVIASLHTEMDANLLAAAELAPRLRALGAGR